MVDTNAIRVTQMGRIKKNLYRNKGSFQKIVVLLTSYGGGHRVQKNTFFLCLDHENFSCIGWGGYLLPPPPKKKISAAFLAEIGLLKQLSDPELN